MPAKSKGVQMPLPLPAYDLDHPSSMVLDLANPKPKELLAIHDVFRAAVRAGRPTGSLPVTTGWNDITPQIAVNLLLRNKPNGNRWLNPAAVFYYANQMAAGDWQPTGQPILIDADDELKDAQHRLYACLISGTMFRSFVVTGIEDIPNMFVYLDNIVRVRDATAALQTAGYNGVSPIIAKLLRFAEEIRLGVYGPAGLNKLARLSPAQVLQLAGRYLNAQNAAQAAASDFIDVVRYLNHKGGKEVVAYVTMRIIDEHDDDLAEEFFTELMDGSERPSDHPITAIRKEIDRGNRLLKPVKRQNLAANLILAFNAWQEEGTLRGRWVWNSANDAFPDIVAGVEQAEAAE